jgi:hypothetical protein
MPQHTVSVKSTSGGTPINNATFSGNNFVSQSAGSGAGSYFVQTREHNIPVTVSASGYNNGTFFPSSSTTAGLVELSPSGGGGGEAWF